MAKTLAIGNPRSRKIQFFLSDRGKPLNITGQQGLAVVNRQRSFRNRLTRVDPPGRIPGKFLIGAGAGDSRDLGDPIFSQQFIGIAVPRSEGTYLWVIHRRQAAVADHRVFSAVLRLYH